MIIAIGYHGSPSTQLLSDSGNIYVFTQSFPWKSHGLYFRMETINPGDSDVDMHEFSPHVFLGFRWGHTGRVDFVGIPFWFVATFSAFLAYCLWRKTRKRSTGSRFPIE